jgi:K+-sensing histidine kinase KdpD
MEVKGEVTSVQSSDQQVASSVLASVERTPAEAEPGLELLALFVHDLESPLASMKYILKLLDEQKLDLHKPRHQQLVSSSRVAVQRAEAVVYDLLAVAKAGDKGLLAENVPVEIGSIVKEAALLASASAAENQIQLAILPGRPNLQVLADPRLLTRVLDNLLFNAVRHTPSGKTITLSQAESESVVAITVLDGGSGFGDINPSILFEKYGQVKLRAAGKHRGVGLGLYFCALAVSAMEGTITAANHSSGGAAFTVNLRKA